MKVLLTGAFQYTTEQVKKIKELGVEPILWKDESKELGSIASEIDIAVCNNIFKYNDLNKFKNLKFIQLTSAGLDRVPIEKIEERNIYLSNARGVYSIPIAEWIILKILELCKNTRAFEKKQINKTWEKDRELIEINGKNIGIIGLGSIGIEVSKRIKSFGTKIIAIDKVDINTEYRDEFYNISRLSEALNKCDIVVLTVPLTEETRGLINKRIIKYMKNSSILINVSRGEIINEYDLIDALKEDKFRGVALDVFESEPLNELSELWGMENVIVTPHNSFVSEGNNKRMFDIILYNLKSYMESVRQ